MGSPSPGREDTSVAVVCSSMSQHITILIPAYNTSRYIGQCLDSVLAQTYTDFDILVVDDGSVDQTVSIVQSYMPRAPVSLLTLPHKGVTYATHIGILNSRGPVIAIVDSDDMMYPNTLHIPAVQFDDPKIGFVWSEFQLSTGRRGWSHPLPDGISLYRALMYKNWWKASHQRFFRKSVYMAGPQLNYSIDRSSDFQLVLLLALSGCKTVHVSAKTYWYRIGRAGSLSSQGSHKQRTAVVEIKNWLFSEITKRGLVEPR